VRPVADLHASDAYARSRLSWLGRLLGLLALSLALVPLLALIVSNFSLTPRSAKLGLLVVATIVAVVLFKHTWQIIRAILQRFGRTRS